MQTNLFTLKSACRLIDVNFFFFDHYDDLKHEIQNIHFSLLLLGDTESDTISDKTCVKIKQAFPKLPVVLLLNSLTFESIHKAINSGADNCIHLENLDRFHCKNRSCLHISNQQIDEFERTIIATIGQGTTKLASDKLAEQLTKYDELIGIPNRSYFLEILEHAYEVSTQWQGDKSIRTPLALVFINIERIEHLRESVELAEIDLLYVLLSSRIKEEFFHFDTLARWSETRFALLLKNNTEAFELQALISKLQGLVAVIEQPFSLINKEVSVSCHIGVCVLSNTVNSLNDLILSAEIASAQAKRDGGMCCRFNSQALNTLATEKAIMVNCLRSALQNEELELFFQPVVSSDNGSVNGAEALLRWKLSNGDWVSPEKIVLLAEEIGLMVELGYWILNTAVKYASNIVKKTNKPFKIAVNLAPVQLKEVDFVNRIEAILKTHHFPPEYLILEITETKLMEDMNTCISNLQKARTLDIGVAIDDFGTGHSSLEYLTQLPVTTLKIDRYFVNKIENNDGNVSIIKAIIGLAHSLDLNVIAEGVENSTQLAFIRDHLNADEEIQGYFFSRPLPIEDFYKFMDN